MRYHYTVEWCSVSQRNGEAGHFYTEEIFLTFTGIQNAPTYFIMQETASMTKNYTAQIVNGTKTGNPKRLK